MKPSPSTFYTYRQLCETGLDDSAIRMLLKEGSLTRVRRGIYSMAEDLNPEEDHLRLVRATLMTVDPGNVISHHSAGVVHGMPVPRAQLCNVTMTRRSSGHASSGHVLKVHDSRLGEDEVVTVEGMPVTSLARTTFDLTRSLDHLDAVAVADAALRAGLSRGALIDTAERWRGFHGRTRAILAADFADPRAESPAESISRLQFARHGIPEPELQFTIVGADGAFVARTDFGWPEFGLVGEVDGRAKYGDLLRPGETAEMAVMNEKRREDRIREAGYWIVRWDWALALDGPALAVRIRKAMELQRRAFAPGSSAPQNEVPRASHHPWSA